MPGKGVEIGVSRLFVSWLTEQTASIAFTTYQSGKLFFIGLNERGELAICNRNLARVMGMAMHAQSLWIATLWQLRRFENVLKPGEKHGAYDRYCVPQLAYTTGDIDVHDVGVGADGEPLFISTLFSCIAKPDAKYSFNLLWKPPFVSRYAAEDRCHLNGLAMRDGHAAYVSCVGRSDANEGCRDRRTVRYRHLDHPEQPQPRRRLVLQRRHQYAGRRRRLRSGGCAVWLGRHWRRQQPERRRNQPPSAMATALSSLTIRGSAASPATATTPYHRHRRPILSSVLKSSISATQAALAMISC